MRCRFVRLAACFRDSAPTDGGDVTLEFTLVGVKDHLPRIAQDCGWNYDQALRRLR